MSGSVYGAREVVRVGTPPFSQSRERAPCCMSESPMCQAGEGDISCGELSQKTAEEIGSFLVVKVARVSEGRVIVSRGNN